MRRPAQRLHRLPPSARERGTVLMVTLLVLALLALGVGSYLSLNLNTARLARRSYQQNAAFHLAEAGAEEALWSLNRAQAQATDAWTEWNLQGTAATRKFSGFDFGAGTLGSIKVYLSDTNPARNSHPTAVASATIETPGMPPNTRLIELTLSRRSYFANGIIAQDALRFAGTNVTVDSWNSDPDNDPATAPIPYDQAVRNDHGTVATNAVEVGAMLLNQVSIWGYAATGGAAPEVGVNGSIRGHDTPEDVRVDPARVSTDFAANLPMLTAPIDGTPLLAVGATLGTAGQTTKWRCASIALRGNQTLTILGDVILVLTQGVGSALDVTGNASLIVPEGSSLTIYTGGDVLIAGNGLANGNPRPATCRIYGLNATPAGQKIHLAGNGALLGVVYAPNAEVQVNGNGDIMGSIVGRQVSFTGNARFHYDESLANDGTDTPFRVTRWRELNSASDRQRWDPVFTGW